MNELKLKYFDLMQSMLNQIIKESKDDMSSSALTESYQSLLDSFEHLLTAIALNQGK